MDFISKYQKYSDYDNLYTFKVSGLTWHVNYARRENYVKLPLKEREPC